MRNVEIDENGVVTVKNVTIEKQTTIQDFLNTVRDMRPMNSPVLPDGCIQYARHNGAEKFIIEERPGPRLIKYETQCKMYTNDAIVSMPWLYWVFRFTPSMHIRVRASQFRIRDLSEQTVRPPLLNMYEGGEGNMCVGSAVSVDARKPNAERVTDFLGQVWETIWQHDLTPSLPRECNTYLDYIEKSYEDPHLWARLSFTRSSTTLQDLIDEQ